MSKFGLTTERYNAMMAAWDNDEEEVECIVADWGAEQCNKGYAIFDYDGTGLLELCKIDAVEAFATDAQAARQAMKDGIKIIPQKELPKNISKTDLRYHKWIDTAENRKNLAKYCENY